MPERRETPRLKTVLKMLGRAGGLRGRVMLVKAGRVTLGAVGTAIDGMSVVGIETAGALGRSVWRLGAEMPGMPGCETTGTRTTTVGRVTTNCDTEIAGIPGKAGREIGGRPPGKPLGKPPGKPPGKTLEGRAIEDRLTAVAATEVAAVRGRTGRAGSAGTTAASARGLKAARYRWMALEGFRIYQ